MTNMKKIFLTFFLLLSLVSVESQIIYKQFEVLEDTLFYEVKGKGEAVLFLSGGPGGSPESLHSIIDYVSKDHNTILLHQRGTGKSSDVNIDVSTITLNQYH